MFKAEGLLQKRRATKAELYQSAKLYELLPTRPNALWQADVTYIHIPGHGWWYAVTVIDYYSRFLLACHLTASYSAPEVAAGIELAMKEAERLQGPLAKMPFLVTDNGSYARKCTGSSTTIRRTPGRNSTPSARVTTKCGRIGRSSRQAVAM